MSFFDDDFYSTKVNRWKNSGRRFLSKRKTWGKPAVLMAGSAVFGALVTLMAVAFFAGGLGSYKGGPAEAKASAAVKADDEARTSDSVVHTAEKVGPTVVSIIASGSSGVKQGLSISHGSGVMFQKQGDKVRIVTNNHVVDGASQLEVVTWVGERKKAVLVGQDNMTDLAVLEIDAAGVKAIAEFGDSDQLKAGQTAIAIGNPLGMDGAPTITRGIISWPKRTIPVPVEKDGDTAWEMEVIQTDAAINQGNSGGALVSLDGKVIGINSMKVSSAGVEGLGFAIPVNQVKPIVETLITQHKVKRPYIGIVSQDLQSFSGTDGLKLPSDVKAGIIVLDVSGPAKDVGLRTNDLIVELDDKPIASTIAMRKLLYSEKKIGDKLKVTFYRGTKKSTVTLTLGELK